MNKKTALGLVILGVGIIVALVLWQLYMVNSTKVGHVEPMAISPPPVAPPQATPGAKPATTQGLPDAPPIITEIPKGIAPLLEPKPPASQIVVPPSPKMKDHYGIFLNNYPKYQDAAKMLAQLKKQGKPAFVQRDPKNLDLFQVWLGPYSSRAKAQTAEKEMHAKYKKAYKIEQIENPVPK